VEADTLLDTVDEARRGMPPLSLYSPAAWSQRPA